MNRYWTRRSMCSARSRMMVRGVGCIQSLSKGDLWKRRRILAYFLIVFFVVLPHLRFGGKPLVSARYRGATVHLLWTHLLAHRHVAVGTVDAWRVSSRLCWRPLSSVACGAAGPVHKRSTWSFLFRPIDRWFEGTDGQGGQAQTQSRPG